MLATTPEPAAAAIANASLLHAAAALEMRLGTASAGPPTQLSHRERLQAGLQQLTGEFYADLWHTSGW